MFEEKITILDFGSQYTQLIARRIRELNVYAEILPFNTPVDEWLTDELVGIVLSGGPASVLAEGAPDVSREVFETGRPMLGICYGMQLIGKHYDGTLSKSKNREYGRRTMSLERTSPLFEGLPHTSTVWMSHGDNVDRLPEGFHLLARTENLPIAAMENTEQSIFALQFHPEVIHTEHGDRIIENFVKITGAGREWQPENMAKREIAAIREKVGKSRVIVAYSGGVDSTVMTKLLHEAISEQVIPIFVDNGLLRKDEREEVERRFRENFDIPLIIEDAAYIFLDRLKGVIDPEKKRKIIGHTFIEVFEERAKSFDNVDFLAQGTLYPDIIESVSVKGPSVSIKSHHNVGGLPEKLGFGLIEPLRELFKDEVRLLGQTMGIPYDMLYRHPFPGPGLAVRILGDITEQRLNILREADHIFIETLHKTGWYDKVWQAFAVLLPVQSVGVMGDERTYENAVVLRSVNSTDGMTADFSKIPFEVLGHAANEIINKVKGINRVSYDISSKPPATIEWE